MTFSKKAFGKAATVTQNTQQEGGVPKGIKHIRSKQNNTLLPDIQIDDLKSIITDDCVNVIDSDSIAFKTCASTEDDYVIVKKLLNEADVTDEKILKQCVFDVEQEFKNKTAFKGAARGEKISAGSVLDDKNLKREVFGLPPYTMADFEVIPKKRLKYENGCKIDGIQFEDSWAVCKYYLDNWIDAIKVQTQVPNILMVFGSGLTHRHDLLLPHQYKSTRTGERPILLKKAREYLMSTYPSEMAPQRGDEVPKMKGVLSRGCEADELVDEYRFKGYLHYRKTGKFNIIGSSFEKDPFNSCGVLFKYTKNFNFDQPKPWLIEHRTVHVGEVELTKGKIVGSGLKHAVMQILLSDTADEYGSRLYLPDNMKEGISYGPAAFYKDFATLSTPLEVLQKAVDRFYEWFPKGLQYTAWDGTEVDEDTLSWMSKCFLCMYMRLKDEDTTKLTDWLDQAKVDYSMLVDNNIEKVLPFLPEDELRLSVKDYTEEFDNIIALLNDKSGKAADKIQRKDLAVSMIEDLKQLENLFQKE